MSHATVADWPLYHYRGEVYEITDGDTIKVWLDYGDRSFRKRKIRLLGFDAPELFRGEDRIQGKAAKDALAFLLPIGKTVYLQTELDRESFDRLLAHGYIADPDDNLIAIAEIMIKLGHTKAN